MKMYDALFLRKVREHSTGKALAVAAAKTALMQLVKATVERVIEVNIKRELRIHTFDRRARERFKQVFTDTLAKLAAKEREGNLQPPKHRTKRRGLHVGSRAPSKTRLDRLAN